MSKDTTPSKGARRPEDPPLGAHMSVAGGLHRAVERAVRVEATALQVFTKQPQRWAEPDLGEEDISAFREALENSDIRTTVSHDSYLINLASPREDLLAKSTQAFRAELARCATLGIDYLVTHPGNATSGTRAAGLERNARAISEALEAHPGETMVLVETTAGTGTALGWRFEELGRLIDAIPLPQRDRVGVCLDSCHVHAAGYDLSGDLDGVLDEFDREIGLDRLRLLHLNDSRHPMGSRKDRHAGIGEGELGTEAFRGLMAHPRLRGVARVIETPKGDDPPAADRQNLDRLRGMMG